MTAEILIMNKNAIALAADSAVTIGNEKTYNGVNKLFMLSNNPPMGIMIYGVSEFLGLPFETLIKEYREQADFNKNNSVKKVTLDFLDFLEKYMNIYVPDYNNFIGLIVDLFQKKFELLYNNKDNSNLKNSMFNILKTVALNVDDYTFKKFIDNNYFNDIPGDIFNKIYDDLFRDYEKDLIIDLLYKMFINTLPCTGIVIAGFNNGELYPSFMEINIFGVLNDEIIAVSMPSKSNCSTALIKPFAQRDVIDNFLTGMDKNVDLTLRNFLTEVLNLYPKTMRNIINENTNLTDDLKNELIESINNTANANNIVLNTFDNLMEVIKNESLHPILDSVNALPKDELGGMCESLINLTSLRRKVDANLMSVGGDIDVAVISKNDGFVWVKRKHYFDKEFNPQFFNRKKYNNI